MFGKRTQTPGFKEQGIQDLLYAKSVVSSLEI